MPAAKLTDEAYKQGLALWEHVRHCIEATDVELLQQWTAVNRCAAAQRLVAKACLQVAVNKLMRLVQSKWASVEELQSEHNRAEMESVALLNAGLQAAVQGAKEHNSLQCFYLACQLAYWVRGQAMAPHIHQRSPLLAELQVLWRAWDPAPRGKASGSGLGLSTWAPPQQERCIGERAPFETDGGGGAEAWQSKALRLAPQLLEAAVRDDLHALRFAAEGLHMPQHASHADYRSNPKFPLSLRLPYMTDLVAEAECKRYKHLLNAFQLAAHPGDGAAAKNAQMQVQVDQHSRRQNTKDKLARKLEQQREREQEQQQLAKAPGRAGAARVAVGAALERPTQEDLRCYLELQLQKEAAAAAAPLKSVGKKKQGKMAAASAQDAVAALRSLLRVAPADLAAAAAQRAQQGALPCETQKRVEQLAQQLAHAAATRAFVVASSDSDSDSDSEDEGARHGRLQATYRWPPVAGPPAAPLAAGGQQEGAAGQGLFMPTKDYSAEELDTFLQGQYLGADTEGMLEQAAVLEGRLGLDPHIMEYVHRTHGAQFGQAALPIRVAVPPSSLPEDVWLEEDLPEDVAFCKHVLQQPHPCVRVLLDGVRSCAPVLSADAPGVRFFVADESKHLTGHFTALDFHTYKSAEAWMPAVCGAVPAPAHLPQDNDVYVAPHVLQRQMKVSPQKLLTEAALARMLLGISMVQHLRSRRMGMYGTAERGIDRLLQEPLLPTPEQIVGEMQYDEAVAAQLRLVLSEAVGTTDGEEAPALIQQCAAVLLAANLVRQLSSARIELDWVNTVRNDMMSSVLLGVRQLLARQRLTRLATRAICAFIEQSLLDAPAEARPAGTLSLEACLQSIGYLPLAGLAQLAAFVFQLVGRCFLGLSDLCPRTFPDLAPSFELEAELAPDGHIQLSDRSLGELLGVPEAGIARLASGHASSEEVEGQEGVGGAELLQQAAQAVAAYATAGTLRQQRQPTPAWPDLLAALQQQASLAGVLLDLHAALTKLVGEVLRPLCNLETVMDSMEQDQQEGGMTADELEGFLSGTEVQGVVPLINGVMTSCQSLLSVDVLSTHVRSALRRTDGMEVVRQVEEADSMLRIKLRGTGEPLKSRLQAARDQLRIVLELMEGEVAGAEEALQRSSQYQDRFRVQLARAQGHTQVILEYLQQAGGDGVESAMEGARTALQQLAAWIRRMHYDALGAQTWLEGVLDCCYLRTQLLLSELHARCRVHPPSELMRLALRKVLPLQWHQEWRSMQANSSEALMAQLLKEEDEEKERQRKKQEKAARRKEKKGSGGGDGGGVASEPSRWPAPSESAGAGSGDEGEQLPEPVSWEAAAEAAPARQSSGSGSHAAGYLAMMRAFEEDQRKQEEEEARRREEQRQELRRLEEQRRYQQQQQQQRGGSGAGSPEPEAGAKKGRKQAGGKKKKRTGKADGEDDEEAQSVSASTAASAATSPTPPPSAVAATAAAAASEQLQADDAVGAWQAAPSKGSRKQAQQAQQAQLKQQQQQQQQQRPPSRHEKEPASPAVLVVPRQQQKSRQQVQEQQPHGAAWQPQPAVKEAPRRSLDIDAKPFKPIAAAAAAPLAAAALSAPSVALSHAAHQPLSSLDMAAPQAAADTDEPDLFSMLGLGATQGVPSPLRQPLSGRGLDLGNTGGGGLGAPALSPLLPLITPAPALQHALGDGVPSLLGSGGLDAGLLRPAVDPATFAAAAAAATVAGTARVMPSLFPQPVLPPQAHQADWQRQLQPLQPPPDEEDVDSMMHMLGMPSSSESSLTAQQGWAPAPAAAAAAAGSSALAAPLGAAAAQGAGQDQAGLQGPAGLAGLRNEAGEYNCFLNVIVQCLWRCADFRQQVLSWEPNVTASNAVAHALHSLFLALQGAVHQQAAAAAGSGAAAAGGAPVAVNPTKLREALAALPGQAEMQLGEMSDAGETLLLMFEKVREASPATAAALDDLFGLHEREAVVCTDPRCGKTSHQNAYVQYFFNTRAAALRRAMAQAAEDRKKGRLGPKTLGARLRTIEEHVYKSCDTDHGGCGKAFPVSTQLEAAPRVFSLQVAWQSHCEAPRDIADTLSAVDETIDLREVYQGSPVGATRYRLRSMVCYYGQHYQALVVVPEAGGWLMFDDTRVSRVGTWADVRRKCEAGRIQPSVLFYELVT